MIEAEPVNQPICRLCELDVRPESAIITPSTCQEIRNIMALELQNRGVVPDRHIYDTIVREYNKRIAEVARDAGEDIQDWTRRDVKQHFEKCVGMVPRIESARQYKTITRIKKRLLSTELYTTNEEGHEVINQKALDNYLKLEARASDVLKQYAVFQKGDIAHLNASNLAQHSEPGPAGVTASLLKAQDGTGICGSMFDM